MIFNLYLPFTLVLKSPAILSALGGDPNSSLTLPYISGSTLRGVVAKALGDPGADTIKMEEFRRLILGGNVRYLNSYPACGGMRSFPVPVSLRREKHDTGQKKTLKVFDLAASDGSESWPEEQLTELSSRFLTLGSARPVLFNPHVSARIHHQRDREKGRAWKDTRGRTHGAVFAFESLDAGQVFKGLFLVRGDSQAECHKIAEKIKDLVGETVFVGRSRRGGYGGRASVIWEEERDREVVGSGMEGMRPVTRDIQQGTDFRILLTSACIVRNSETGQVDPTRIVEELENKLGSKADLVRKRWAFEKMGGFNRKWRLATPQVLAVAAGSVLIFTARETIPLVTLCQIMNEGIGERLPEGCGRLLFLDKPLETIQLQLPVKSDQSLKPNQNRVDKAELQPPELVSFIEKRILDAQINRRIAETAAGIVQNATDLPSNNLIGRFRTILRPESPLALNILKEMLCSDKPEKRLRRSAMDQIEGCRVFVNGGGGKLKLLAWLKKVTEIKADHQNAAILSWIGSHVVEQRHHVISKDSAHSYIENNAALYALRLIDSVLAGMAIRNKLKENNKTKEIGDDN